MTSATRRYLVMAVVALSGLVLAGCFEASDAAVATLENDTAGSVELRLCSDNACEEEFYPPRFEVAAGESVDVNVSKSGGPNVYLVRDSSGRRTGCLPIVVDNPAGVVRVQVSVSAQLPCSDEVPEQWP
jgi:hypothetical protein